MTTRTMNFNFFLFEERKMNPQDTNHLTKGSICWTTSRQGRLKRFSPNSPFASFKTRRVRLLCLRSCCGNNYLLSIFIKFYKFYLHRLTGPSALPGMHPAPPESWQLGHQWMWATKWNVWWSRRIILCLKLSSRIKLLRVQIRKKRIFYHYWMILGTSLLFFEIVVAF